MEVCNAPISKGLDISYSLHIVISIIMSLVSIITLISTLSVLASFKATYQLNNNPSNTLITCFSISDAINSAITLPLFVYLHIETTSNCTMQIITTIISTIFSFVSGTITVLIAIERYLYMNPYPGSKTIRMRKWFQAPCLYQLICSVVITACLQGVAMPFIYSSGEIAAVWLNIFFTVICMTGISIMTAIYVRGYLRIRKIVQNSTVCSSTTEASGQINTRPLYIRSLQSTVYILITAMVISYAPFAIACIIQGCFFILNVKRGQKTLNAFTAISILAIFSNSTVNSFVIIYKNKKAKEWLLQKIGLRHSSSSQSDQQRTSACNLRPSGSDGKICKIKQSCSET